MATPAQQAPWSVKGITPQTREAVKVAARRSGMTIGEWLNAAITHQAENPLPARRVPASAHDLRWAEIAAHLAKHVRSEPPQAAQPAPTPQMVSMHAIERLLKETQARQEQQLHEQTKRVAEALTNLARYIERSESLRVEEVQKVSLQHDKANSDLIQTLNLMAQRMKRMERQLAHMPQEIIAPVKEAASQHLDAFTRQIVPAMEERLTIQMRDILHNLSIPQSQVTTATATATADTEQLRIEDRLARAIVDIRTRQVELARLETNEDDDSAQRAILERLEGLSRQLDTALAASSEKTDSTNLNDVLKRLDCIDSRLESARAPLDVGQLENMVRELSENIEALHISGERASSVPGTKTLDILAEQISHLAQRLDDVSRQPHPEFSDPNASAERERFAALETAVSTLSLQLRDLSQTDTESLERVAKAAAREALAAFSADNQSTSRQRATRTDDALEAVHSSLERIIDRLTQLEEDMHSRTSKVGAMRHSVGGEPERRAALALSQASYNDLPTESAFQDGPENLLVRESVGLTENLGLTANFIAAARRAAMAAADETRFSGLEYPAQHNQSSAPGTFSNAADATGERRRSLLIGLGALIAATGAAQIATLIMQGATRLS